MKQTKSFDEYLKENGEYGVVKKVHHPIAWVEGLPSANPDDLLIFQTNEMGQVYSLKENLVEVSLITKSNKITVGTKVVSTGGSLKIPVSKDLLGSVINPVGERLTPAASRIGGRGAGRTNALEYREVDIVPPGLKERGLVREPFGTGIGVVDLILPLGKGQRELIVGDRQTGKSTFLFPVVKQQVGEGHVVIYVFIGKKPEEIKRVYNLLKKDDLLKKTILVATYANDPSSLIYLAPFAGMTIAEYFRDQGQDCVVLMDDLTTHARYYREIALVSKRFPGKDSYPGDVFYIHARILERAGSFAARASAGGGKAAASVSITCLPVAETTNSNFTDYIISNLISITDGHIHFSTDQHTSRRRPAIDIFLSVTRVGKQTQTRLQQQIAKELMMFLSNHQKILPFIRFGSELSDDIKKTIKIGSMIYTLLNQKLRQNVNLYAEMAMVVMAFKGMLFDEKEERLAHYRDNLSEAADENKKVSQYLKVMAEAKNLDEYSKILEKEKNKILEICKTKKF